MSRQYSWPVPCRLAQAGPMCSGRAGPKGKAPRQWRWASPRRVGFPCGCPCCCPKRSLVPPPMCGCSCYRRCAGSSREGSPCGSAPVCWFTATFTPKTAPIGPCGITTTSRPTWPRTVWPSMRWRTTLPRPAATTNAPPKGQKNAPKSMWCRKGSSPSGSCRKKTMQEEGVALLRNRP